MGVEVVTFVGYSKKSLTQGDASIADFNSEGHFFIRNGLYAACTHAFIIIRIKHFGITGIIRADYLVLKILGRKSRNEGQYEVVFAVTCKLIIKSVE